MFEIQYIILHTMSCNKLPGALFSLHNSETSFNSFLNIRDTGGMQVTPYQNYSRIILVRLESY
jgi:hypothetical protein